MRESCNLRFAVAGVHGPAFKRRSHCKRLHNIVHEHSSPSQLSNSKQADKQTARIVLPARKKIQELDFTGFLLLKHLIYIFYLNKGSWENVSGM